MKVNLIVNNFIAIKRGYYCCRSDKYYEWYKFPPQEVEMHVGLVWHMKYLKPYKISYQICKRLFHTFSELQFCYKPNHTKPRKWTKQKLFLKLRILMLKDTSVILL